MDKMPQINKALARRSFSRAAAKYDSVAVLQREISKRMMQRLDIVKMVPKTILDAGCGTGFDIDAMLARYKKAKLFVMDFAVPMLNQARKRGSWLRKATCLCGDLESLPLADNSIDLIYSNVAVQWVNDPQVTFTEFRRVLKPNGLLMFSTFGPDTLKELRKAWSASESNDPNSLGSHVNPFIDMHDLGDALMRSGFADPVMDVDQMQLTYSNVEDLMRELKVLGAHNVIDDRNKGLTGKGKLAAMKAAYEEMRVDGVLPASYEVVYGHAWMPSSKKISGIEVELK